MLERKQPCIAKSWCAKAWQKVLANKFSKFALSGAASGIHQRANFAALENGLTNSEPSQWIYAYEITFAGSTPRG